MTEWAIETVERRFWVRVDRDGPVPDYAPHLGPCWLWLGTKNSYGYGRLIINKHERGAHRFAYERQVGPIPAGLEIDHLCRVRHCVNPTHLEPVTTTVNIRRGIRANSLKTHCKYGHAFDEANTYRCHGHRYCRACGRESARRKRKEAA